MKILIPATLAICALFTGCLPPPVPGVVVAPGYHHYPYGYRTGHPYHRGADVVVVNRKAPVVRHSVHTVRRY